ncbi:class I SAM-dependent methyltransferase [Jiangella aurantiaca]|uniref:Class I SAM-dependent methyltransferase n=1 Tax=Jiangella aurantiaca TaxID=2530373 RepID=A0A4R5ANM8_9ACTN|nr:class I SAM-dependent methyltransferase [Jiangella aurantiaca]
MLTVARRLRPDLEWQHGDAGNLPFPANAFDRVLCQRSLMFFPDRARALAEMARVTSDDGVVAVVVPASITDQPAYGPLASVIAHVAGSAAASLMDTYWSCGDLDELRILFESAGLQITATRTHLGTARFSSIDAMVATEVKGSPLARRLDEAAYHRISRSAHDALRTFETPAGAVHAPLRGHIVAARRFHG